LSVVVYDYYNSIPNKLSTVLFNKKKEASSGHLPIFVISIFLS